MSTPWAAGAVTGLGPLPGDDAAEAASLVLGELPDFPHLPELPARGAGADAVGRAGALLLDMPIELVPSGWRITAHDGRDVRRARDFLAWDLDALQTAAEGFGGPLKVQTLGPWTLAASLELPSGHKVVSDHGAVRDLAASLAEGLTAHLAAVRGRVPGATPVLQLDELALPDVLAGRVPTPSGYGTVRAVANDIVEQQLRTVLATASAGGRAVHCGHRDAPLQLLRDAGADAITVDPALITTAHLDAIGEAIDAGVSVWLAVVAATDTAATFDTARAVVERLWNDLGFARDKLAANVVPIPAGGLADVTAAQVKRVCAVLRDVGKWLADL